MATIQRHEPVLDGIRGLAIILVLLAHSVWVFGQNSVTRWLLPAMTFGWCGVDLFFVLSGYLITGILIRTKAAENRARAFYMRRFLRIFPIYYLALAVILIAAPHSAWLRSQLSYYRIGDRIAYFAYLQNWLPLRHSLEVPSNILGHFWSLAVEEQFYLVWPWLVWAVSEKHLLRICIVGTFVSLALRCLLVWHFGPQFWIHVLTPTRGAGLLVGSALATYLAGHKRIPVSILAGLAFVGAGVIKFISLADPAEFMNTSAGPYMYTIGTFGLALLFGALVGSSQQFVPLLTPILNQSWLRSFGKYSYGLYVYHLPVFFLFGYLAFARFAIRGPLRTRYAVLYAIVTIATTFGVAWLSYQLIENPLLKLKGRFAPVYETPKPANAELTTQG